MSKFQIILAATVFAMASPLAAQEAAKPNPLMSFFVTSVGKGDGANLGGLAGADAHCLKLAQAAGAAKKAWRAYLSTQGSGAVNARDRIGQGPWYNFKGDMIAQNLSHLHGDSLEEARAGNRIYFNTALTETGREVNGHDNGPDISKPGEANRHDILTGSQPDGRTYTDDKDHTCKNWTSNKDGSAQLGHHNRVAWNSAHPSRSCSQPDLVATGGAGLMYCFATD